MATRLSDIVRAIPARLRLQGTAAHALETARHRLVIGGLLFAVAFAVVGEPKAADDEHAGHALGTVQVHARCAPAA